MDGWMDAWMSQTTVECSGVTLGLFSLTRHKLFLGCKLVDFCSCCGLKLISEVSSVVSGEKEEKQHDQKEEYQRTECLQTLRVSSTWTSTNCSCLWKSSFKSKLTSVGHEETRARQLLTQHNLIQFILDLCLTLSYIQHGCATGLSISPIIGQPLSRGGRK